MDQNNGVSEVGYRIVSGQEVPEAGMIVYWRLSGGLDLARLREEWAARDLNELYLPDPPSPQSALHRSVRELSETRKLVRPLEGKKGWALVEEHADGADLDYSIGLRVSLDEVGRPRIEPEDHPRACEVLAAYNRNLDSMNPGDVSGWLCRLMEKVDAVSLRDTGGVYFVPKYNLYAWRKMAAAIKAVSAHSLLGVPAVPAEETIAAILDAITTEAQQEADALEKQILGGDLGERALETRIQRTNKTEEKLGRYEGLLGQRLDGVRERLEGLRAQLGAAMLVAQPQMTLAGA